MHHTFVGETSINNLEDIAVSLTSSLITLMTLHNLQVACVSKGILPEDMMERANTIAWDLKRLMKQYQQQLADTLDLLPDDFDASEALKRATEVEKKKARSLVRKK